MLEPKFAPESQNQEVVLLNEEKIRVNELQPPIEIERYFIVPEKCDNCAGQQEVLCAKACPEKACIIKDTDLEHFHHEVHPEYPISKEQPLINQNASPGNPSPTNTNPAGINADTEALKNNVKEYILHGKLVEALTECRLFFERYDYKNASEVLILESAARRLIKDFNLKVIDRDRFEIEYNSLSQRFLSFMDIL